MSRGDSISIAKTIHGHSSQRRGQTRSATYNSWRAMMDRCGKRNDYIDVEVCERWKEFKNFLEDMGERPVGKTLDRYPIRHGNYEPGNCRWATPSEQAYNRGRRDDNF